ncbi:MAG: glycosyltransferase [Epibacterium sp.]
MQVIGLCRFSYPAIGGFQVEHQSHAERIAFLYDDARIEERFRLFETVALPSLRAQTDQDFDLVIVIGSCLPARHEARLRDLVSGMPQVRIEQHPPRRQREIMKDVLNRARRDPTAPCLQFRFDDDDAVSVDFVERLRSTIADCPGLVARHKSVAVDFNMGYVAEFGAEGIKAAEVHSPYNVAALGMYVRGGAKVTIMNFAHHKILRFMPTVTLSDAPMFVRGWHGSNDSRQKPVKSLDLAPLTPAQVGEFEARFAIREDQVRQVFSAT